MGMGLGRVRQARGGALSPASAAEKFLKSLKESSAVRWSVSAFTFWYVSWSPYTIEPGRLRCLALRIA